MQGREREIESKCVLVCMTKFSREPEPVCPDLRFFGLWATF